MAERRVGGGTGGGGPSEYGVDYENPLYRTGTLKSPVDKRGGK